MLSNIISPLNDIELKVVTHMMPDLPNVGLERDIEQFIEFFENPAFRPDGLKLYPTLVIRGTGSREKLKSQICIFSPRTWNPAQLRIYIKKLYFTPLFDISLQPPPPPNASLYSFLSAFPSFYTFEDWRRYSKGLKIICNSIISTPE